jgi:FMN phosphatase YigB (HAD superfamily)
MALCGIFAGAVRASEEDPARIRAVLFDLGNTLVHKPRRWVEGAPRALKLLAEAGIPVGLISNTGSLTREDLLAHHLPPDFSFQDFPEELVLLSSEVGFEKPNLAIFSLAAEKAGLLPGEILFLDENLTQVVAAQRAGLLALRVSIEFGADGTVVRSDILDLVRGLILLDR